MTGQELKIAQLYIPVIGELDRGSQHGLMKNCDNLDTNRVRMRLATGHDLNEVGLKGKILGGIGPQLHVVEDRTGSGSNAKPWVFQYMFCY